jgi:phospholipid transport system substrate-binding protein
MNTMCLPRRAALSGLAACLLLAGVARAETASDAVAPIAALVAGLNALEKQEKGSPFLDRYHALEPVIDRALNLPQILQTVVGLRWASLPQDQKDRLATVFRAFTVASYVANFSFGGDTVAMLPETRTAGTDTIVETQIVSSNGSRTRVDYAMRKGASGWQAVDVLLEGTISRVAVQRSDFRSLLESGSAQPLIESLERKVDGLSGGALRL